MALKLLFLTLILGVSGRLIYFWYVGGYDCVEGNCRKGRGVLNINGTVYAGEFMNGALNGYGKAEYVTGCYYEGHFKDGYYDGYGVYTCPKENKKYLEHKYKYEGNWIQGIANGYGIKTANSGKQYSGVWQDNILCLTGDCVNGYGKRVSKDYDRILEGKWTNGKLYGYGIEKDSFGNIVYKGYFKRSFYHGRGTLYINGKVVKSGKWERGEFLEPSKEARESREMIKKIMKNVEIKMKND